MKDYQLIYEKTMGIVNQLSPYYVSEGEVWYNNANKYCSDLSIKYNVNIRQVAAIMSALSPMKEWEVNKRQTEQFLVERKCGTFGRQIEKGLTILDTVIDDLSVDKADKLIMQILNGRKTQSFYHNIVYPDSSFYVTVDRHMMKLFPDHWTWIMTDRKYRIVEEVIQQVSSDQSYIPCKLQAILWLKLKEIKG